MERKQFKQVFNQRLEEFLDEKIDNLRPYFFDEKLEMMITYLKEYVGGGKRFRPYLVFLFYKLMGGEKSDIFQTVLSIELIHIFALIHDDIADKGIQRHGIDAYHVYTSKLISNEHR
jgi:geranylgeranyl diphosphate synthase type I